MHAHSLLRNQMEEVGESCNITRPEVHVGNPLGDLFPKQSAICN